MTTLTATCKTCKFSLKHPYVKDNIECRRFPPDQWIGWPKIRPEWWCGEWEDASDPNEIKP